MGDERVVALDSVSLDIYRGEIICLLGVSGSGKSTFLNMLAGLEKPTKGEIVIGGIPVHKLNEEQITLFRQKNIGFIFQSYNLLPMLTALENVSMPLVFQGIPKAAREKSGRKILELVGLKGFENRTPPRMSGGQQQRVGIARAIVGSPKIVFADEPTGNLDTHTSRDVLDLLIRMSRDSQQTLIIVTHDRSIARCADRVVTLEDGSIINIRSREEYNDHEDKNQETGQ